MNGGIYSQYVLICISLHWTADTWVGMNGGIYSRYVICSFPYHCIRELTVGHGGIHRRHVLIYISLHWRADGCVDMHGGIYRGYVNSIVCYCITELIAGINHQLKIFLPSL